MMMVMMMVMMTMMMMMVMVIISIAQCMEMMIGCIKMILCQYNQYWRMQMFSKKTTMNGDDG